MIKYVVGNIFDSHSQAIVNTVNTDGVMGKGIALQFKKLFPDNFKIYAKACKEKSIGIGKLLITKERTLTSPEQIIVNFPTKTTWRKPSEYHFIEDGLDDLIKIIEREKIKNIAIPPLGAGNGGLDWQQVKLIIERKLGHIKTDIYVYEPTSEIKEVLKEERTKLTDSRALLLYVLYDLVRNGEYVSEFSSEKVCYFLQRFGAKKYFKLQYEPNFYGPYSGKVRFMLNVVNGSYIMGYSDMTKKPFDPLLLVSDGFDDVKSYVESNTELNEIAHKTQSFLRGFYSDYALELLSSIDHIVIKSKTFDKDVIYQKLEEWSERKKSLFSNRKDINLSIRKIENASFCD